MGLRTAFKVVAFLVVLAAAGLAAFVWRPAIDPIAEIPAFDHAVVVRGAQLAAVGDCAICHAGRDGAAYAGGNPVQTPFGAIYASNITPDVETGIGGWSLSAFTRAMREGVDRAGNYLYPAFPYNHYAHATAADISAIYAFMMTRQPVRVAPPGTRLPFPLNIRPIMAFWNHLYLDQGPIWPDLARSNGWNHGAYLVESLGHCQACHTPHNLLGAEEGGRAFTGGLADGWEGPGLTAASSPAAVAWTSDALYNFLRQGIDNSHAAAAGPMGAVSHDLSAVPEAEVRDMADYIASRTGAPDKTREQQVAARVAASAVPPARLAGSAGAAIFAGACAGCHGAGAPMMLGGRPSLALGSSVTAAGPRNAIQVVLWGIQPLAGESGPWMPGFAASLTDAQVASVLGYLRARFADQSAWTDLEAATRHIREDRHS